MSTWLQQRRNARWNRPAVAGLLLGLFLALLGMAQFQALHAAVHCDAGHVEHRCGATLLTAGQVEAPTHKVSPVTMPGLMPGSTFPASLPLVSHQVGLPPDRGPPVRL